MVSNCRRVLTMLELLAAVMLSLPILGFFFSCSPCCCVGECCPYATEDDVGDTYTIDFGAGGLGDFQSTFCDEVAGDIVVTDDAAATCRWSYSTGFGLSTLEVGLGIEESGGQVFWRATVAITGTGLCLTGYTFNSTPVDIDDFDATDMPVTLTESSETTSLCCTGSLPATIELGL